MLIRQFVTQLEEQRGVIVSEVSTASEEEIRDVLKILGYFIEIFTSEQRYRRNPQGGSVCLPPFETIAPEPPKDCFGLFTKKMEGNSEHCAKCGDRSSCMTASIVTMLGKRLSEGEGWKGESER